MQYYMELSAACFVFILLTLILGFYNVLNVLGRIEDLLRGTTSLLHDIRRTLEDRR
jgi:hypothetical protein